MWLRPQRLDVVNATKRRIVLQSVSLGDTSRIIGVPLEPGGDLTIWLRKRDCAEATYRLIVSGDDEREWRFEDCGYVERFPMHVIATLMENDGLRLKCH